MGTKAPNTAVTTAANGSYFNDAVHCIAIEKHCSTTSSHETNIELSCFALAAAHTFKLLTTNGVGNVDQ